MPDNFGEMYFMTAIVQATSSIINGYLSRKQQKELAEKNQIFTEGIERNRRNFQLRLHQENANVQREMGERNHQFRLAEQQNNFELICKSAEWQHFLNDWPLRVQPSVLRQEQIIEDGSVALRVFFSKSVNKFFANYIYPKVEQGLLEYIDCYHNVFLSNNIIFYHNAYRDNVYGGAINSNIKYALQELPVIIIDSNVLCDEICVSATIWGFGKAREQHETIFKLPYKIETIDGKVDMEYVNALSNQLLAYLKFVLGCAYDTYNLIMYNKPPLLPKISRYELDHNIKSSPLVYKGLQDSFGRCYNEIYLKVLGDDLLSKSSALLVDSVDYRKTLLNKKTLIHKLRLEYAISTKNHVDAKDYAKYLDESVMGWCELRTTGDFTEFINECRGCEEKIFKYFSVDDVSYFLELCNCYKEVENLTSLGRACLSAKDDILPVLAEIINREKNTLSPKSDKTTDSTTSQIAEDNNGWIEL